MSRNLGGPPPGVFPPIYARDNADDNVAGGGSGGTIGIAIEALPDHQAAHDETMSNRVGCIPDYRRRIKKFIQFINEDYIRTTNRSCLIYRRNNVRIRVCITMLLKIYGTIYSTHRPCKCSWVLTNNARMERTTHTIICGKYHDAILYCSILAKVPLPDGYKREMKNYLHTLKKEKTKSRSAGICQSKMRTPSASRFTNGFASGQ